MKKKLLTVFLAAVMVFGVFSLTACGNGANPDDDYNYYASKYGVEGELRIDGVTFFAVQKMCAENGKFLLYIDNEDAGFAERIKNINDLAKAWDVYIYHFNPDLGGGYAKDDAKAQCVDLTKDLSNSLASGSHIESMQKEMKIMLKLSTDVVPNHALFGIQGAPLTYNLPEGYYVKEVAETDARYTHWGSHLHYFNAEGQDLTQRQLDIFDIKYPGRTYYQTYDWSTWMSNIAELNMTRAYNNKVTMATEADYAAAIRAIAQQKPSYQLFATEKDGKKVYGPECYETSGINTFNIYGDNRFHIVGDFDTATNDFTGEKQDVYQTVANYEQFAWLMDHNDGHFMVFFGGPWCPSTAAIAKYTNDLAKEYGIKKIYFFDPRLDSGVVGTLLATSARWAELGEDGKMENPIVGEDGNVIIKDGAEINERDANGNVKYKSGTKYYSQLATLVDEKIFDNLFSRNSDSSYLIKDVNFASEDEKTEYEHFFYNGNFLYANFMDKYMPDYDSYWNDTYFYMDRTSANDANGQVWEKAYSKLTVPGIMMFDGGGGGAAKCLDLAEAEFTWSDTKDPDSPQTRAWMEACRRVIKTNPYASNAEYLLQQATANANGTDSSNSNSNSASNSGSNASGGTSGGNSSKPEVC